MPISAILNFYERKTIMKNLATFLLLAALLPVAPVPAQQTTDAKNLRTRERILLPGIAEERYGTEMGLPTGRFGDRPEGEDRGPNWRQRAGKQKISGQKEMTATHAPGQNSLLLGMNERMTNEVAAGFDPIIGSGRIDALNAINSAVPPEPFTDIATNLIGVYDNYSAADWGDYDDDGDLDILLAGTALQLGGFRSNVYRNEGASFQISFNLTHVSQSSIAWGDYNNDGDLDILLSGQLSFGGLVGVTKIYRNDGVNFNEIVTSLAAVRAGIVTWNDYDNDGDLDVLLTGTRNSGEPTAKIFRNDVEDFVDSMAGLTPIDHSFAAWGDYDNDGDSDLITTGLTSSEVRITIVYRNDEGNFVDILSGLPGVTGPCIWGDYDNDGDLDILLAGSTGTNRIAEIYQNQNGIFSPIVAGLVGVEGSAAAWGDYDNDGDLDILLTGYSDEGFVTRIYRNDLNGFTDINAGLPGVSGGSVAWGDYDDDGDLDILLTGTNGPNSTIARVYRNNTTVANTVPTAPAGLNASVSGNAVTLNWNKSIDNQTAQNTLTYNLRIGKTSGGTQIVSPMANTTTGYRKVPQLGNTNHKNGWTIKNLSPGTYYWSVQAIDNAFAGSAFAPEQSFTIVSPPTLTVTLPAAGATWPVDSTKTILWNSNSVSGNVNIKLSTNGGVTFPFTLASNTTNDGSENVIVPDKPSSTCRVRVESVANTGVFGDNPGNFKIASLQAWVVRYDGPANGTDEANALALDSAGNVYVTGFSLGSSSNRDFLTLKYNSDGERQWVARFNTPVNNIDEASDIAVDASGNILVAGFSVGANGNPDYFIIKFNSSGMKQWSVRYNGSGNGNDKINALAVDGASNVYVTGHSFGAGGSADFATIKYNSAGVRQWVRRYNAPANNHDEGKDIVVDGSGNVYVTGQSYGAKGNHDYLTIKYNSGGTQQWVQRYNGPGNGDDITNTMALDGASNVYITGHSIGTSGSPDFATIKYNSSGVQQWVARYNSPVNSTDEARDIAVDTAENVYVTGYSPGVIWNHDYFTVKYNSAGVEQWSARYNGLGNGEDIASDLAVDGSGNVYVAGHSFGSTGSLDYTTIMYNNAGVQQWIARFNAQANNLDEVRDIAVNAGGDAYVTGYSITANGQADYVTIKYSASSVVVANAQMAAIESKIIDETEEDERTSIAKQNAVLAQFTLAQNYPNPFNPSTMIGFALREAGEVTLKIYSTVGQLIKQVASGKFAAGEHYVNWDGRNAAGEQVAAGVYLYSLVVRDAAGAVTFTETKRMTLLK